MGIYDKEPLSCNGHSNKNISESVKKPLMEFLFILYKHLVHLLSCRAVHNHPKLKKCHIFF